MKFFTNQSIWKKIVIALLVVLLFNAVVVKPVHADSDSDVLEGGGKLLKPIFSLLVTIGDGIVNILHSSIMGVDETLIKINNEADWLSILKTIIAVVITAACIIGAIFLSGPIAFVLGAIAIISVATAVLPGTNFVVHLEDELGDAIVSVMDEDELPSKLYLPMYSYSPEEIFRGNILLFNVNFFRTPFEIKDGMKKDDDGNDILSYHYYEDPGGDDLDVDGDGKKDTKGFVTSKQDSAAFLQKIVSSWYNAIRNICLVMMLSILVYIGIRILLSSVASDKAKYQTMLKDWVVGLCLLFLTHYIMAFSVTIVDKITKVVSHSLDNQKYMCFIPETDEITDDMEELGLAEQFCFEQDGKDGYLWPSNLMGFLRLKAQMTTNGWQYIGEAIMFLILTIFTLMFTITYLRRLLYMTFLTILAPLVSLTYCIDKLNDGQAQGFNKWLREYIFNLLIQPMHLLLYYILVTSAFDMIGKNVVYSIVAIGFMLPAEKLLRSLFGFEKAPTASAMSPTTAMMASTALTSLLNRKHGAGGKGDKKSDSDDDSSDKVPKVTDPDLIGAFSDNGDTNENSEDEDDTVPALDEGGQEPSDKNENGEDQIDPRLDLDRPNLDKDVDGKDFDLWSDKDELDSDMDGENFDLWSDEGEDFDLWSDEDDEDSLEDGGGTPRQEDKNSKPPNLKFGESGKQRKGTKLDSKKGTKRKTKEGKRRPIRRRLHAAKSVLKTAGRTTGRKTFKAIKGIPGKGLRMAGSAAVGALAAGAGIAIGAATGDFNNVVKMGLGSATSGYALASSSMKNTHIEQEYKDAYKQAKNSSEYKQEAMDDYVKKYRKNIELKGYLEEAFGAKQARVMLRKNGEVEQYVRYGITDKSEIKAMHKLINNNVVKTPEQAAAISEMGKMIGGDPTLMTAKKQNEWKTTFKDLAAKERCSGYR